MSDSKIPQNKDGLIRAIGALALVMPPWLTIALMSMFTPKDYFTPLFTAMEGQIMLGICGILSVAAFLLSFRSKSVLVWILSFVILVCPQMLVPFLGPSIITIIKAIGPVVGS